MTLRSFARSSPGLLAGLIGLSTLLCGCLDLGFGGGGSRQTELDSKALENYLAKAEVARPEVTLAVMNSLRQGQTYRQRVQDQRNRWCLLTVWLAPESPNVLNVVTKRDETCPQCKGTGKRTWDAKFMQNLPMDTFCLKCKGTGSLPNEVVERQYVLAPEDFANVAAARETLSAAAYQGAPPGTESYVQQLASAQPTERLAACVWLDENYVKVGQNFQQYLPMLKKSRWREVNDKAKQTVYQFWAGKDIAGEEARAYYRVYVDNRNGRIQNKGFYQ